MADFKGHIITPSTTELRVKKIKFFPAVKKKIFYKIIKINSIDSLLQLEEQMKTRTRIILNQNEKRFFHEEMPPDSRKPSMHVGRSLGLCSNRSVGMLVDRSVS